MTATIPTKTGLIRWWSGRVEEPVMKSDGTGRGNGPVRLPPLADVFRLMGTDRSGQRCTEEEAAEKRERLGGPPAVIANGPPTHPDQPGTCRAGDLREAVPLLREVS